MTASRVLALASVATLALTATAGAAVRKVPQTYPTIQSAVTASSNGDTILISAGEYRENVNVPLTTTGLIITTITPGSTSCNNTAVIVDATPGGTQGDGFDIYAKGTTVQCLTIRHADYAVYAYKAANVTVDRVRALNCDYGIYIDTGGDGAQVLGSLVQTGYYEGIYVTGNNAVVQNNIVNINDDYGIYITGDNAKIMNNIVQLTYYNGIYVSGDLAQIQGNSITATGYDAIEVSGDGAKVVSNTTTNNEGGGIYVYGASAAITSNIIDHPGASTGVYLSGGDGSVINGNTVTGAGDDYGFDLNGNNMTVSQNKSTYSYDAGLYVSGDNPFVQNNTVSQVSDDDGIDISCSTCGGGRVESNSSSFVGYTYNAFDISASSPFLVRLNTAFATNGDGFYLSMSNGSITGNKASYCGYSQGYSGFDISGNSNFISGNVAVNNGDAGIYLSGNTNTVQSNSSNGNYDDGFEIYGTGNIIKSNAALSNQGEGFENGGTTTLFTNNSASKNRFRGDCTYYSGGTQDPNSSGNSCADNSNFAIAAEIE